MLRTIKTAIRGRKDRNRVARRPFRPTVGALEARLVLATGVGLSPPWVTFQREVVATIGQTPGIFVTPLVQLSAGQYAVGIATQDLARGISLATVVAGDHDFGGVDVKVIVGNYAGTPYEAFTISSSSQLAAVEQIALSGNRQFSSVVTHPIFPGAADTVFPIFTKSVVQFPNDNLADAYQNFNAVTAAVYGDILANKVGNFDVSPSTVSTQPTSPSGGTTLAPPWVTFQREVVGTIGQTPGIFVTPLVQLSANQYAVGIATPDAVRGISLATVVAGDHDFGGVDVKVIVGNYAGTPWPAIAVSSSVQLAALEQIALSGNPLFASVTTHPIFPGVPDTVFPIFIPAVVQFPNDNLADAYQNFNGVAADVFGDVLAGQVGGFDVSPSTVRFT
jgi:hypothetical protein